MSLIDNTDTETLSEKIYAFIRSTVSVGQEVDPEDVYRAIYAPQANITRTESNAGRTVCLTVFYYLSVWGYARPFRLKSAPKRPRFIILHPLLPTTYRGMQEKWVGDVGKVDEGSLTLEEANHMIHGFVEKTMRRVVCGTPLSEVPLSDLHAEVARRFAAGEIGGAA
jgi:hypothetical protein